MSTMMETQDGRIREMEAKAMEAIDKALEHVEIMLAGAQACVAYGQVYSGVTNDAVRMMDRYALEWRILKATKSEVERRGQPFQSLVVVPADEIAPGSPLWERQTGPIQRANCQHEWRTAPGTNGLIDKCRLCGEERA